jgi:hypothetical protein
MFGGWARLHGYTQSEESRRQTQRFQAATRAVRNRFNVLSEIWKRETAFESSAARKAHHPAYRAIIRMGPQVVQLILEDLQKSSSHWFIGLRELTKADPVPVASRGDVEEMRQAWIRWGRMNVA